MDPTTVAIVSVLVNIAIGVISALMKRMIDANEKRIDSQDAQLGAQQKELWQLRELLPQHYVRRDDYMKLGDDIFTTLRRIEDKLDKKVDK